MENNSLIKENLHITDRLLEDLQRMKLSIPDFLVDNLKNSNLKESSKTPVEPIDKSNSSSKQSFKIRNVQSNRPNNPNTAPGNLTTKEKLLSIQKEVQNYGIEKKPNINIGQELFGIEENDNVSSSENLMENDCNSYEKIRKLDKEFLIQEKNLKEENQEFTTFITQNVDLKVDSLDDIGKCLPNQRKLRQNESHVPSITDLGASFKNQKILWVCRCNLQDLQGIERQPNLEEIFAAFNSVSSLPAALCKNNKLQVIDLEANEVSDIQDLENLAKNKKFIEINLKDNPINSTYSFQELSTTLKRIVPSIKVLNEQDLSLPLKKENFKKKATNPKNTMIIKNDLKASCKNFKSMLASHHITSDLLKMDEEQIDQYVNSLAQDNQAIEEEELDDYDLLIRASKVIDKAGHTSNPVKFEAQSKTNKKVGAGNMLKAQKDQKQNRFMKEVKNEKNEVTYKAKGIDELLKEFKINKGKGHQTRPKEEFDLDMELQNIQAKVMELEQDNKLDVSINDFSDEEDYKKNKKDSRSNANNVRFITENNHKDYSDSLDKQGFKDLKVNLMDLKNLRTGFKKPPLASSSENNIMDDYASSFRALDIMTKQSDRSYCSGIQKTVNLDKSGSDINSMLQSSSNISSDFKQKYSNSIQNVRLNPEDNMIINDQMYDNAVNKPYNQHPKKMSMPSQLAKGNMNTYKQPPKDYSIGATKKGAFKRMRSDINTQVRKISLDHNNNRPIEKLKLNNFDCQAGIDTKQKIPGMNRRKTYEKKEKFKDPYGCERPNFQKKEENTVLRTYKVGLPKDPSKLLSSQGIRTKK